MFPFNRGNMCPTVNQDLLSTCVKKSNIIDSITYILIIVVPFFSFHMESQIVVCTCVPKVSQGSLALFILAGSNNEKEGKSY